MDNLKVAEILEEIADMLDIKGEKYKPRAYRRAALSVRSLSEDIKKIKERGELKEIPGVGKAIEGKIEEILESGSSKYLDDLKQEIPVDVDSLLSVEGVGPKTIKTLHEKLKVKNIDDLEEAAKNNKIRDLGGFGKKSEQKILENIDFARKSKGRFILGYIEPIVKNLKNKLENFQYVEKVEIAGSFRRRKETIGDIDILVVTKRPTEVMDFFTTLDDVDGIIVKGDSKSTVRLKEGLDCDIRVIDNKSFGSALLYFTGSKQTNIEMRKISIKKGLKLSEYGLFKGEMQIAGETEEEVFQKLGMKYIEPELRENRGEIEVSLEGKLPKLIGYNDIKGDLQMHTKWSDGVNTVEQMAKAGKDLGYEYIAITDHTGSLRIAGGLNEKEIKRQMKEIDKVNQKINGITILKGVEVNIQSDGKLDVSNKLLEELDIVVASIHTGFRQTKEKMTGRIISAMENENVNIIAHPTGRKIKERKAYELDFDKILKKSKETNTFLEINSYPIRLDLNDINTKRAIESGCKLAINTDAHSTNHLRYMELGIATARRGWAGKKNMINTLPLKKLRKILEK
ncbi:MAG: DNA polymerase/3'-5' exonuclease PolX [Candidatus Aenigmarchaeota archaeon]|nr:DNA polymerase/3'-5' exonuclease PolX [Candidatus Aenigmarchaeota archaeon]